MARGWKCPRCSTQNGEGTLNCSKCSLIRGGVVVPSSYTPSDAWPAAAQGVGPETWLGAETARTPAEGAPSAPTLGEAERLGPAVWTPSGIPDGPAQSGWVAQPSAPPPRRRYRIVSTIFGLLILVGAVVGLVGNASRSSTGEISRSGDMMATDLRLGDCFDLKEAAANEISDVTARPCSDQHEYELVFTGSMAEGAYPSDAVFSSFMEDNCIKAFDTYIGAAYDDSKLDMYWLYPNADAWKAGDRSIQCAAFDPQNDRLTKSLKGSAR